MTPMDLQVEIAHWRRRAKKYLARAQRTPNAETSHTLAAMAASCLQVAAMLDGEVHDAVQLALALAPTPRRPGAACATLAARLESGAQDVKDAMQMPGAVGQVAAAASAVASEAQSALSKVLPGIMPDPTPAAG
jgi:hypothetical protein